MSLIGGVAGTVAREGVRAGERAVRMAARQQSVAQRAQQRTAGTVAVRAPAGLVRQRQPAVDLAETLEFTDKFLEHFIVMPSWASRIQTDLWIAHNHGRDENRMPVWQYTPRLAWLSAKPGGGKSWGQKITSKLVADGKVLIEPSEAAVARKVGRQHQTVFLDEADILFGTGSRKASLRSIINAGYEPDGEWSRAKGSGEDTTDVPVFGFLGFAGLQVMRTGTGDHLNALFDRCLFNMMRKAPKGYRPPRFDDQARAVAAALSERLARAMAQEVANGIAKVVPAVPEGLGNRPAALWEPLLAVADAAGGDWPEMAREACEELESNDGLADEDDGSATLLSNYFSQLRTPALTAGGNEGEEDE